MLTNSFSPFRRLKRKAVSGTSPLKSGDGKRLHRRDLLSPTTEEIKDARPFAMVLPQDVLNRAGLITATLFADTQGDGVIPCQAGRNQLALLNLDGINKTMRRPK